MCTSADDACGDLGVVEAGRRRLVRSMVERINADDTRLDDRRRLVAELRAFLAAPHNGDLVAQVRPLLADEPHRVARFEERVESVASLHPSAAI